MALSDPQSVTIGGSAATLPRTSTSGSQSSYTKDDGAVVLNVAHQVGKRVRRTARITSTKISTDPLVTTQNIRLSASVYIVLDVPSMGFTVAEQTDLITSLTGWLTASTNANAKKLIGGES